MKSPAFDLRGLCLCIAFVDSHQVPRSPKDIVLNDPSMLGVIAKYGDELLTALDTLNHGVCSGENLKDARWDHLIEGVDRLSVGFGLKPYERAVIVHVGGQQIYLVEPYKIIRSYPVSTAQNGMGSQEGSNKTPLGAHVIRQKIGERAPLGAIFVERQFTNKTISSSMRENSPGVDQISTRIMWLDGLEPGLNRGAGIDSHDRFIYIHGTQQEGLIGTPASKGCIRMKNKDVADLFNLVSEDTLVQIQP